MNPSRVEPLRAVITTEQIQKRVKELARQISDDYRGQTIQMLAVLENAFMFMADLVRAVEVPVVCQFIKPKYTRPQAGQADVMEIFFSHEPDIRGQHILLVEGLVHSGVTSEFLMSDLRSRGAASVKLVTLLDEPESVVLSSGKLVSLERRDLRASGDQSSGFLACDRRFCAAVRAVRKSLSGRSAVSFHQLLAIHVRRRGRVHFDR
jgi:hypoxanthine phosphoribosyltransferase